VCVRKSIGVSRNFVGNASRARVRMGTFDPARTATRFHTEARGSAVTPYPGSVHLNHRQPCKGRTRAARRPNAQRNPPGPAVWNAFSVHTVLCPTNPGYGLRPNPGLWYETPTAFFLGPVADPQGACPQDMPPVRCGKSGGVASNVMPIRLHLESICSGTFFQHFCCPHGRRLQQLTFPTTSRIQLS
jgi:hypothetical protein